MNRAVLTASADVDVQVAFDNRAAFEGLSGIHGVDDLLLAHFIAQTIAGFTEHTGDGRRGKRGDRRQGRFTDVHCIPELSELLYFSLFNSV